MTNLHPKLIAAITTIAMTAPVAAAQAANTHTVHQTRHHATASSQRHVGHFGQLATSQSTGSTATFRRYGSSSA